MADAGELLHDLNIAEPMIIQGAPLVLDDNERVVTQLLDPLMGKGQSVPKSVDLVTYVPCPSGCDITLTKVDGISKWTGLFWFSCMDIQSLTKSKLLQGLEEYYGNPTGCGAVDCVASRLLALQHMDKPDMIPCIESDCDLLARPDQDNNCNDHTEVSVTAMVLMETRKFTKELLAATKKVLKVLTSAGEQDPTGFASQLTLDFPQLHLMNAGLRSASGSGFCRAVILSLR